MLKGIISTLLISSSLLFASELDYSKPVSKDILVLFKDIHSQKTQIDKEIIKLKSLIKSEKNYLTEQIVDKYQKEKKRFKIYNNDFQYKMSEYKDVSYLENVLEDIKEKYKKDTLKYNETIEKFKNKIKCFKDETNSCENPKLEKYFEQIQFLSDLNTTLDDNISVIRKEYFSKYNILEKGIINNLVELKTQVNSQLTIIK